MTDKCKIGNRWIGKEETLFLAANIGVNHNGEVSLARRLVEAAAFAGCDAVVLQKCEPERHIPQALLDQILATPWGDISYLEYRRRMELGPAEFQLLSGLCRELEIGWAVTVRDIPSVDALANLRPDYYRVPAASMEDAALLAHLRDLATPVMLCARPDTAPQVVRRAVEAMGRQNLVLIQGDTDRPMLGQRNILPHLRQHQSELACPVGVAGGETQLVSTMAAIAMGASVLERPVTLHRSLWGGNQAASIEPWELQKLTRQLRLLEMDLHLIRQRTQGASWLQQALNAFGGVQAKVDHPSGARMPVGWKNSDSFRLSVHLKKAGCSQFLPNGSTPSPACASGRFPGEHEKWRQNCHPAADGFGGPDSAPSEETCGDDDN